jgi:hypothetical protein
MNVDVADGLLLDVRDISLTQWDATGDSALDAALARIMDSASNCNFNSFGSSIG